MNKVFFGDCRETMKRLIAEGVKVQTCVTSPPYWGLRNYGIDGQLGLEKTPQEYVEKMVEVFGLVRDLLSEDGTLWLNLGDSFASGKGTCHNPGGNTSSFNVHLKAANVHPLDRGNKSTLAMVGLKPKDLVGIPWRVAFALQADGWYLRSDIIWDKPNPMPESVEDRPTKSHEYIFLLSKNERYYYDFEAVKEPCQSGESDIRKMQESKERIGGKHKVLDDRLSKASMHTNIGKKRAVGGTKIHGNIPGRDDGGRACNKPDQLYRNRRSVWRVATTPYPGSHFATFPPALIQPCIMAGARTGDIVLDPFFGSGTTGQVAEQLGRQWIGCEIQTDYEPLQKQRTAQGGLAL